MEVTLGAVEELEARGLIRLRPDGEQDRHSSVRSWRVGVGGEWLAAPMESEGVEDEERVRELESEVTALRHELQSRDHSERRSRRVRLARELRAWRTTRRLWAGRDLNRAYLTLERRLRTRSAPEEGELAALAGAITNRWIRVSGWTWGWRGLLAIGGSVTAGLFLWQNLLIDRQLTAQEAQFRIARRTELLAVLHAEREERPYPWSPATAVPANPMALRLDAIDQLKLIAANEGRPVHLSGLVMRAVTLEGIDLAGADLSGADLRDSRLGRADLSGADLRGAELRLTNLRFTNLRGADLRGADLTGADLLGADLTGADLLGADLSGASLTGANFRGARLIAANRANVHWASGSPPAWPDGLILPENARNAEVHGVEDSE